MVTVTESGSGSVHSDNRPVVAADGVEIALEQLPPPLSALTAVVALSTAGRVVALTPPAADLFGVDQADVLGHAFTDFMASPEAAAAAANWRAWIADGGPLSFVEQRLVSASGAALTVEVRLVGLRNAAGLVEGAIADLVDVTARVSREAGLALLADTDPLTGLLNRRGFERLAKERWSLAVRYGDPGALLLIDLDWFKAVNDESGHEAGDRVLRRVAQQLRARLRDSDLVARLGGDEFAVLLPRADVTDASVVAQTLLDGLRTPHNADDAHAEVVTASIGIRCSNPKLSHRKPCCGPRIPRCTQPRRWAAAPGRWSWRVLRSGYRPRRWCLARPVPRSLTPGPPRQRRRPPAARSTATGPSASGGRPGTIAPLSAPAGLADDRQYADALRRYRIAQQRFLSAREDFLTTQEQGRVRDGTGALRRRVGTMALRQELAAAAGGPLVLAVVEVATADAPTDNGAAAPTCTGGRDAAGCVGRLAGGPAIHRTDRALRQRSFRLRVAGGRSGRCAGSAG